MAALDETKARLLRGAVQDNIGVVQGVRVKRVTRQTRRLKFWLSGSLVAVALVCLTVAADMVSGRAPLQSAAPVNVATPIVNVGLTPEWDARLCATPPIDSSAAPLTVTAIVLDPR